MKSQASLRILGALWQAPGLSRCALESATGLHANTVARVVTGLIRDGYLREGPAAPAVGRGRPRIPLEIDARRTCVGGLAVGAGAVEAISLNLRGHPLTAGERLAVKTPGALSRAVGRLMDGLLRAEPVAIGVSVTGLVDPDEMRILFSSAAPGHQIRLGPALLRAGDTPVVLNTEEHALSARWLMDHAEAAAEDVLMVTLEDGAVGASLLINGHPNRGCVLGGNELGHMRLGVDTARCYCGGSGCVERVFSTAFLRAAADPAPLIDALSAARPGPGARRILELTAQALANATIFIRPRRLVVAGSPVARAGFRRHLETAWRQQLPPVFRTRVQLDWWPIQATVSAETAAWLAIARVMHGTSRRVFEGRTRH